MLRSRRSQRVRHNLMTEQQQKLFSWLLEICQQRSSSLLGDYQSIEAMWSYGHHKISVSYRALEGREEIYYTV